MAMIKRIAIDTSDLASESRLPPPVCSSSAKVSENNKRERDSEPA
jgi:hypothetical protein